MRADPPTGLYLELTNRCNLHCGMCWHRYGRPEAPRDLPLEEAEAVLDRLPSVRRVHLHGLGEPLLAPAFLPVLRLLAGRGIDAVFNTNGTLLSEQTAREIVLAGAAEVRVSLDAASKETYGRLRGKPDLFAGAIDGVRRLLAARGRTDRPRLTLWFTAMRSNLPEFEAFVRLAAALGVDGACFQRLVYDPGSSSGLAVEAESLMGVTGGAEVEMIRAGMRAADETGLSLEASGRLSPLESLEVRAASHPSRACRRPWSSAYVSAHGTVLPCCFLPFDRDRFAAAAFGNLFETPFETLWNGPGYQEFRRRLAAGDPPGLCRSCGVRWSL